MEEKIITNMIATLTHDKEVINKVTFMVKYFFLSLFGVNMLSFNSKVKKGKEKS